MNFGLTFTRPAIADMGSAHDWYENQRAGLGKQFLSVVDAAMATLAERPERFPLRYSHFRRVLVRKFPYAIYYSIDANTVLVHAVIHMARDPALLDRRS